MNDSSAEFRKCKKDEVEEDVPPSQSLPEIEAAEEIDGHTANTLPPASPSRSEREGRNLADFVRHQQDKNTREATEQAAETGGPFPSSTSAHDYKGELVDELERLYQEMREHGFDLSTSEGLQEFTNFLSLRQLPGLGMDLSTPEGLQKMIDMFVSKTKVPNVSCKAVQTDTVPIFATPSQSQGYDRVSLLTQENAPHSTNQADDASTADVLSSNSINSATPPVSNIPTLNPHLSAMLAAIFPLYRPKIVPAPQTTNPLVILSGEVYLHCRSRLSLALGTIFAVHKIKLQVQSPRFLAHMLAKPPKLLFPVDTDEPTLRLVTNWVHYPFAVDLKEYTTEQVLNILVVSLIIQIPKLHNAILGVLLDRHSRIDAMSGSHVTLEAFEPSVEVLRSVYRASVSGDGARKMCSFLLCLQDERTGVTEWGEEIEKDIQWWRTEGEVMWLDGLYMDSSSRAANKKERKKDGNVGVIKMG